ncbi:hypothetical protein DDI74_19635 [Chryseobacterium gleum]|nr:hypothetical protein DDI74_19635 [Chryseobacterium gleum]
MSRWQAFLISISVSFLLTFFLYFSLSSLDIQSDLIRLQNESVFSVIKFAIPLVLIFHCFSDIIFKLTAEFFKEKICEKNLRYKKMIRSYLD